MKSSIASRSLKLLSLATQIGQKELTQNIKDRFNKSVDELTAGRLKTRIDQARLITEHLSQLKGAAMKAGQLLSLDATDFFPPEAVELLSKLQGQAEPVGWPVMQQVLRDELGDERMSQFRYIDETAAASASIGQVHRGEVDGQGAVAVKIQYPGVSDSIDSDLGILKTLAQSLLSVSGRRIDLGELFEELKIVLHQEADYRQEVINLQRFEKLVANSEDFVVPHALPALSSRRVLTMTWQEGLSVAQWLKRSPSVADRKRIGTLVLDLYCREFFDWGLVQTDPNYANFLIQVDAVNPVKLVLLDFGATLSYSAEFRRDYIEMLKAVASLDRQRIFRQVSGFKMIDPRESDEAKDLFVELLVTSLAPFERQHQPFRFRSDEYAQRTRDIGRRFTASLKYSAPPRQIIFLHRKLGGIFALLKTLDIELDLTPYWERMLNATIEDRGSADQAGI